MTLMISAVEHNPLCIEAISICIMAAVTAFRRTSGSDLLAFPQRPPQELLSLPSSELCAILPWTHMVLEGGAHKACKINWREDSITQLWAAVIYARSSCLGASYASVTPHR